MASPYALDSGQVLALTNQGLTKDQIAARLFVHPRTVSHYWQRLRAQGLLPPLTHVDDGELRRRYARGESCEAMALELEVSRTTVERHLRKMTKQGLVIRAKSGLTPAMIRARKERNEEERRKWEDWIITGIRLRDERGLRRIPWRATAALLGVHEKALWNAVSTGRREGWLQGGRLVASPMSMGRVVHYIPTERAQARTLPGHCPGCGNPVERPNARFCSVQCQTRSWKQRNEGVTTLPGQHSYDPQELRCLECGAVLTGRRRITCSTTCAAARGQRKHRRRYGANPYRKAALRATYLANGWGEPRQGRRKRYPKKTSSGEAAA